MRTHTRESHAAPVSAQPNSAGHCQKIPLCVCTDAPPYPGQKKTVHEYTLKGGFVEWVQLEIWQHLTHSGGLLAYRRATKNKTRRTVCWRPATRLANRLKAASSQSNTAGANVNVDDRFLSVTDQDVRELIKNTTASSAIGFRTNAIGSARLGAYQELDDEAGSYEELDRSTLLSVFASKLAPLVGMIEFDLITTGRAFVWVNKVTHAVETWELERLDPAAVSTDEEQRLDQRARQDGVSAAESRPPVFYYRDPYGGLADELKLDPLNCLMLTTDQHLPELFQATDAITLLNNIYRLNMAYFERGVLPGRYSFQVKAANRHEFEAAKAKLKQAYGRGVETGNEVNVHDDTKVKIEDLGESNREMEMLGGIDAAIRDIARAFRIPSPLLNDPRRSTYNNVHEARLEFYNGTIRQRWQTIATQLTGLSGVILDGYVGTVPEGWRLRFDTANIEALREPLADVLQYAPLASGRAPLTVNDVRQILGMPPITDDETANELYIPAAPTFGAPADDEDEPEPEDDEDDRDDDEDEDDEPGDEDTEDEKNESTKKREKSPRLSESQWRARENRRRDQFNGFQRRLDALDARLGSRLAQVFGKISDEVSQNISRYVRQNGGSAAGLSSVSLFNADRAEQELHREAFAVLQRAYVDEFNVAASSLDVARTRLLSLNGEAYLTRRVEYFSQEVTGSVRDKLADWINRSTTGELPPREFAKEIKTLFDNEITDGRSRRIARTESTAAANFAHHEAYAEGAVAEVEWVAAGDDRTREDHADANGQRVELGQPFSIGSDLLLFPGDSSQGASAANLVNCRCVSVPV